MADKGDYEVCNFAKEFVKNIVLCQSYCEFRIAIWLRIKIAISQTISVKAMKLPMKL